MRFLDSPYSLSLTQERRHTRRRKVDSVVYVNIGRDNGGVLLDLSEEGMCISVANRLTVASEIRFELGLTASQPIDGTGYVSWLSESGKSAGVRYTALSNESRMLIRKWLAEPVGVEKMTEPAIATDAGQPSAPSSSWQAPADTDAEPAAAPPHSSRSRDGLVMPQSPLFFFPQRPAADEVSGEQLSSQQGQYRLQAENIGSEYAGERVEAFRAAIISQPEKDEEISSKERRFKKAAIVFTLCIALLAAGVAAMVAYPQRFAQLRQLTATLTGPSAVAPAVPAKLSRPERSPRRRVARRPMVPVSGPQRGSHAVGYSGIFDAPTHSGPQFSAQANSGSLQTWSTKTSGRRLVPRYAAQNSAGPEPVLDSSAKDNDETASTQTAVADSQAPTQIGRLRIDGGLVDEGSVNPTFAPLNLDGQTLDSKPIVVEAVIGKDGSVEDVHLVSSPASSLAEAVMAAVKQWRYRPFYRDGQPVEFVTRITFDFSLPNGNTR
jgi:TonB family protein